jgi:hypothetical protein
MEGLHVGQGKSLNGRRIGLQSFGYGSSQISEPRISNSISRFISSLVSFGLIPKP